MTTVHIRVAGDREHLDEAATIWAEATAARDGEAEVAPLSLARPLIQRVIERSPRSLLVVALDASDRVVGFAAVEPVSADGSTAEVRYLAVRPGSWGGGVGRQLMLALPGVLAAAGFTHGELDVYLDNPRAVNLYEELGWIPSGDAAPHPRTGRLEQRYRLGLAPHR
ncbi:GNAT family N-acetyltransferase [Dactylosporangium sp. NBC_01737]|uniref:GNAT family N-acetyltransferase n=1 Tax=Dactylosporangium sp. NBC_01737 TaxID=2975959 RepID=UPI002E0E17BC|nr:GNAT family N-acetyltransferase [Dactylosporangium sp. NBC_01737]